MAKSINKYNVAISQQSGKVGTVRYYQRGGETYVRSAHNSVKNNPRTDSQMVQRMKFASRSVLWAAMKGNLKSAFSAKGSTQSDFNAFMKLNNDRGVFFTKMQMAKGAQVIFPIQITDGKLESIISSMQGGRLVSSIALGNLALSATTTVNELANAIVANNADFEFGDEISFISALQSVNSEGTPKVKANFYRIVLNRGDLRKVHELASADGFQSVAGYLGTNAGIPAGCFAYVHSRRDGKLLVSSQLLVSNNDDLIAFYSSDEQFELARNSYGAGEDLFLNPGSSSASNGGGGGVQPVFYTLSVGYAAGCDQTMGTVTGSGSYQAGASAVISALAKPGYAFVRWDDGNVSAQRTITVGSNCQFKAVFEADAANSSASELDPADLVTITLSIPAEMQHMGEVGMEAGRYGATATKTVPRGSSVTVNAITEEGFSLDRWSNGSDLISQTIVVNDDMELIVYFVEEG